MTSKKEIEKKEKAQLHDLQVKVDKVVKDLQNLAKHEAINTINQSITDFHSKIDSLTASLALVCAKLNIMSETDISQISNEQPEHNFLLPRLTKAQKYLAFSLAERQKVITNTKCTNLKASKKIFFDLFGRMQNTGRPSLEPNYLFAGISPEEIDTRFTNKGSIVLTFENKYQAAEFEKRFVNIMKTDSGRGGTNPLINISKLRDGKPLLGCSPMIPDHLRPSAFCMEKLGKFLKQNKLILRFKISLNTQNTLQMSILTKAQNGETNWQSTIHNFPTPASFPSIIDSTTHLVWDNITAEDYIQHKIEEEKTRATQRAIKLATKLATNEDKDHMEISEDSSSSDDGNRKRNLSALTTPSKSENAMYRIRTIIDKGQTKKMKIIRKQLYKDDHDATKSTEEPMDESASAGASAGT